MAEDGEAAEAAFGAAADQPDDGAGVVPGGLANQPGAGAAGEPVAAMALALMANHGGGAAHQPQPQPMPMPPPMHPPDPAALVAAAANQPGAGANAEAAAGQGGDQLPLAPAAGADAGGGEPGVPAHANEPDGDDPSEDSEDEGGGKSICSRTARVAQERGCLRALTDSLHAMCELAGGVQIMTAPLLCNQPVTVGRQVTALRLTAGLERVQAVSAYVDKLFATGSPPTGQRDGLICAFLAVLEVLAPEPAPERPAVPEYAGGAVPVPTERDGSPGSGFLNKIAAFMDVREERKTSSKQCSPQEMRDMGKAIAPLVGAGAKGSADLPSAQQTKTMLVEITKHNRFPCESSCQPDKILRYGGDSSLAAPKPEKGKDLVAEETTCAREVRRRFRTYTVGIGGCLKVQPDSALDNMHEAATAALEMHEALADAEHLVSFQQVTTAINNCLKAARNEQNGDEKRRRGFTHACRAGAQAIRALDTPVGNSKAMGLVADAAAPSAAPGAGAKTGAGDDDKPMTFKQMQQVLAGLKPNKPGKRGSPRKDRTHDTVDVPGKGKQKFERLQGGNDKCPVDCTRNHGKNAWCGYNHSKK